MMGVLMALGWLLLTLLKLAGVLLLIVEDFRKNSALCRSDAMPAG